MNSRAVFALFSLFLAANLGSAPLLEDVIEKQLPFASDGKFFLQGLDGAVQVYGSAGAELKITAIRKAFSPARLNAIEVQIEQTGNVTRVSTALPPAKPWRDHSGTVNFIVEIPQNAAEVHVNMGNGEMVVNGLRGQEVSAKLRSGRLTSRNCFCNQDIRAVSGGIDLIFDWAEKRVLTAAAQIESGNIAAMLPPEISFQLTAEAPQGHVTSDFTEAKNRGRNAGVRLEEAIGHAPESILRLTAREGNIRISEVIW